MARKNLKIGDSPAVSDIPKRDDYAFRMTFTEPSTDVDVPVDITGWTFITTLTRDVLPDDPEDELAAARRFDTAPASADSTAGEIVITLTGGADGDTDIEPGDYVLTVRRTISGTSPWVVHQQFIRVLPVGAQRFTA